LRTLAQACVVFRIQAAPLSRCNALGPTPPAPSLSEPRARAVSPTRELYRAVPPATDRPPAQRVRIRTWVTRPPITTAVMPPRSAAARACTAFRPRSRRVRILSASTAGRELAPGRPCFARRPLREQVRHRAHRIRRPAAATTPARTLTGSGVSLLRSLFRYTLRVTRTVRRACGTRSRPTDAAVLVASHADRRRVDVETASLPSSAQWRRSHISADDRSSSAHARFSGVPSRWSCETHCSSRSAAQEVDDALVVPDEVGERRRALVLADPVHVAFGARGPATPIYAPTW
jgi:hypothetical protein